MNCDERLWRPGDHNFALADGRCNGDKADRLAAFEHLERWCARNARPEWTAALEGRMLAHDIRRTGRVAAWAYGQADLIGAIVWERGRDAWWAWTRGGGGCWGCEVGEALPVHRR